MSIHSIYYHPNIDDTVFILSTKKALSSDDKRVSYIFFELIVFKCDIVLELVRVRQSAEDHFRWARYVFTGAQ